MNQPILVTGGGGTLGRRVVARPLDAGQEVRVLSRRPRPAGGPAAAEWVVVIGHHTPAAPEATAAEGRT